MSVDDESLHRNIKLKIAGSRKPWSNKLKVKNCGGRYLVQKFHSCKSGNTKSTNNEDDVSELGISLYHCMNGLRIQHTHTCNGVNDCLDNSDEDLCQLTEHLSKYSKYKCGESPQIIKRKLWCDGNQDCFYQGKQAMLFFS